MAYLNLMRNRLKPKEVNDALENVNDTLENVTNALENISNLDAEKLPYDNTSSGLTATNVQSAIDEVNTILGTHVTLLGNKALTGGTWVTETLGADIDNFRYLAFTLGFSDNGADQSGFNVVIPTSAFKLSTTTAPVGVVHDYLTSADSKSCLVAYATDTTISIYKGADIGSYRFSVIGIM